MRNFQHKYHDRIISESPQNLQAKGQSMQEGDDESKSAAKTYLRIAWRLHCLMTIGATIDLCAHCEDHQRDRV